jgi:hypothetical protein
MLVPVVMVTRVPMPVLMPMPPARHRRFRHTVHVRSPHPDLRRKRNQQRQRRQNPRKPPPPATRPLRPIMTLRSHSQQEYPNPQPASSPFPRGCRSGGGVGTRAAVAPIIGGRPWHRSSSSTRGTDHRSSDDRWMDRHRRPHPGQAQISPPRQRARCASKGLAGR